MNKEEKYALFLGMLSGDGCLSIAHNGEGYRDYPIDFCNTEKGKVILFEKLFFDLFGIHGTISSRRRPNRKEIWGFNKKCKAVFSALKDIGFPEGVKRDVLRVPEIVKNGSKSEKLRFIYGMLITDGSLKKNRGIMFHLGSKLFIEDLSRLIAEFIGREKPIWEFTPKRKIQVLSVIFK